jgi:hypothetical protein
MHLLAEMHLVQCEPMIASYSVPALPPGQTVTSRAFDFVLSGVGEQICRLVAFLTSREDVMARVCSLLSPADRTHARHSSGAMTAPSSPTAGAATATATATATAAHAPPQVAPGGSGHQHILQQQQNRHLIAQQQQQLQHQQQQHSFGGARAALLIFLCELSMTPLTFVCERSKLGRDRALFLDLLRSMGLIVVLREGEEFVVSPIVARIFSRADPMSVRWKSWAMRSVQLSAQVSTIPQDGAQLTAKEMSSVFVSCSCAARRPAALTRGGRSPTPRPCWLCASSWRATCAFARTRARSCTAASWSSCARWTWCCRTL